MRQSCPEDKASGSCHASREGTETTHRSAGQTFTSQGACARRNMLSLQISKLLLQPLSMAAYMHIQDNTVQRHHFAEQQLGRLSMA